MPAPTRLVLLHGTQLNSGQWLGYADLLGPGIDLVTPDLPAHGSRRDEPFTWEGMLTVIGEAVDAAGERPVVLGGHSLGGYLSAAYAAAHPTRLAGLALLGAAGEPGGMGSASYRSIVAINRRLGPRRMTRILDLNLRLLGTPGAVADELLARGYAFGGVTPAWSLIMERCSSRDLTEVTCPILLLAGQFDQLRIHTRRYAAAASSSSQVRVVTVPRASHAFPLSHAAQTAAELRRLCEGAQAPVP